MPSQIEVSDKIKEMVANIKIPVTPEGLVEIKKIINKSLTIRPYNDETKEHEALIRWKRVAAQILDDGYVYAGKACTDIVILFLAFCHALGLETRFVKVIGEKNIHSIAEIKLDDGWYVYDVSSKSGQPEKGEITGGKPYKGWKLWKKGRDAWDLGLVDFASKKNIT